MGSSKRQQTMAKMARERAVKEKRARKQEKKDERREAAAAARNGEGPEPGLGEARLEDSSSESAPPDS